MLENLAIWESLAAGDRLKCVSCGKSLQLTRERCAACGDSAGLLGFVNLAAPPIPGQDAAVEFLLVNTTSARYTLLRMEVKVDGHLLEPARFPLRSAEVMAPESWLLTDRRYPQSHDFDCGTPVPLEIVLIVNLNGARHTLKSVLELHPAEEGNAIVYLPAGDNNRHEMADLEHMQVDGWLRHEDLGNGAPPDLPATTHPLLRLKKLRGYLFYPLGLRPADHAGAQATAGPASSPSSKPKSSAPMGDAEQVIRKSMDEINDILRESGGDDLSKSYEPWQAPRYSPTARADTLPVEVLVKRVPDQERIPYFLYNENTPLGVRIRSCVGEDLIISDARLILEEVEQEPYRSKRVKFPTTLKSRGELAYEAKVFPDQSRNMTAGWVEMDLKLVVQTSSMHYKIDGIFRIWIRPRASVNIQEAYIAHDQAIISVVKSDAVSTSTGTLHTYDYVPASLEILEATPIYTCPVPKGPPVQRGRIWSQKYRSNWCLLFQPSARFGRLADCNDWVLLELEQLAVQAAKPAERGKQQPPVSRVSRQQWLFDLTVDGLTVTQVSQIPSVHRNGAYLYAKEKSKLALGDYIDIPTDVIGLELEASCPRPPELTNLLAKIVVVLNKRKDLPPALDWDGASGGCTLMRRHSLAGKSDGEQTERYVLLPGWIDLGSAPRAGIRLEGKSVRETHAYLIFYRGFLFVAPAGENCPLAVGETRIPPGEVHPLVVGDALHVGEERLLYHEHYQLEIG